MASFTKTWEINTLERDVADGYVTKIIYRVKGIDGSEEKHRETGEVRFVKPSSLPSDFIAYEKLTSDIVIGWLKAKLGTDEVARIEKYIDDKITLINTPVTVVGKPWEDSSS